MANTKYGSFTQKLASRLLLIYSLLCLYQVHRAVLKDGSDVVMKIQYPGVADSIESDIENVRLLLTYTNLIPKGLFLDRAMEVDLYYSDNNMHFLLYFCSSACICFYSLVTICIFYYIFVLLPAFVFTL
jgi:hypothetical protein